MALEEDLMTELLACCPSVYVLVAPSGAKAPYITWQHAGGDSLRWADNTAADKRFPQIQVNAWASTPQQAFALIQLIEERLCLADSFNAEVQGEAVPSYDDDDTVRGYIKTFKVLGAR